MHEDFPITSQDKAQGKMIDVTEGETPPWYGA